MKILPLLPLLLVICSGCNSLQYETTKPDGTHVKASITVPFFYNAAVKGLAIDSTTKTTTNGFRVTNFQTEGNPEMITASSTALGDLIGAAGAAAAKGAVK